MERRGFLSAYEPEEPVAAPAARVGADLRDARERLGWSLPAVANHLRIRLPYLHALEDGRSNDLPGAAYAIGFLRTYASALGLDADEIARRFRAEATEPGRKTELNFPAPVPSRGVPAGAVVLIGCVIAIGGYVAWYHMSETARPSVESVQPVPPRLAPLAANPPVAALPPEVAVAGAAAKPEAGKAAAATQTEAGGPVAVLPPLPEGDTATRAAATAPAPIAVADAAPQATPALPPVAAPGAGTVQTAALQSPPAAPPAVATQAAVPPAGAPQPAAPQLAASQTAAPQPAVPPPGQVSLAAATDDAAGPGHILLRATGDAWVQVRERGGHVLLNRVMRSGETWPVPDRPALLLTTGNAAATEVVVDGQTTGSLGGDGAVRRDLPLDAAAIRAGKLAPRRS